MSHDLLSDWMPLNDGYSEDDLKFIKSCLYIKLRDIAKGQGYETLDSEWVYKKNTLNGDPYRPFDTIGLKFKVEKIKEIDDGDRVLVS